MNGVATVRQQAEAMERAWNALPPDLRAGMRQLQWRVLEFPERNLYEHGILLRLAIRKGIDELWARIDRGELTVKTALSLAIDAERTGRSLAEVLEEHDSWPLITRADGIKFRRKPASVKRPGRVPQGWEAFRKLGLDYAATLTKGMTLDRFEQQGMQNKVLVVLAQAQLEIQNEVARLRRHSKSTKAVAESTKRRAVVAACRSLAMDPPGVGKPVDMEEAKRQKRRFARAYHPDSNNGVVDLERYQATLDAYTLLEEYNAALTDAAPALKEQTI